MVHSSSNIIKCTIIQSPTVDCLKNNEVFLRLFTVLSPTKILLIATEASCAILVSLWINLPALKKITVIKPNQPVWKIFSPVSLRSFSFLLTLSYIQLLFNNPVEKTIQQDKKSTIFTVCNILLKPEPEEEKKTNDNHNTSNIYRRKWYN